MATWSILNFEFGVFFSNLNSFISNNHAEEEVAQKYTEKIRFLPPEITGTFFIPRWMELVDQEESSVLRI